MSDTLDTDNTKVSTSRSARRFSTRFHIFLRRCHLYAGLMLLPWVFLYGITGAMYNHYGLLPDASFESVPASELADTELQNFPGAESLADQVIEAIRVAAPDSTVQRTESSRAEFVNDLILQVNDEETRHAVHIDPVSKGAWVASTQPGNHRPQALLKNVRNIDIHPSPFQMARNVVPEILEKAGVDSDGQPQPMGWCKLNFLAEVDGQKARITYVLRDGHVDVSGFDGQPGMSNRSFFLRLHTTHGQPPHWNGRMIWSLFVDAMAIAMVLWGITGLVMWWQIKRTRLIGGIVLATSLLVGTGVYFSMIHFYATTRL